MLCLAGALALASTSCKDDKKTIILQTITVNGQMYEVKSALYGENPSEYGDEASFNLILLKDTFSQIPKDEPSFYVGIELSESLYGETIDGGLIQDLTVAQYADGSLTTLYHFDGGVVRSWQQFFSPDGSKIVLAWAPSAEETDQWNLSVVDLSTGEASMVDLPEMTFPVTITNEETGETSEETKNAELLLVKWQDDSNLVVLGSLQNYSTTQAPYIWLYTLP